VKREFNLRDLSNKLLAYNTEQHEDGFTQEEVEYLNALVIVQMCIYE